MSSFDLLLDNEGDISFVDNFDIKTISNSALVAQDIKRQLEIPLGALPWDREAGSRVLDAINDNASNNVIEQEMLRIARLDERIDQESVHITYDAHGKPIMQFIVLADTEVLEVKV